jgi:uncharacterized membrane protein
MMLHLTPVGTIHSLLAMFCIAIGLIQLLRPKRGPTHRARGYAFVYAALVADGTAMLVYRFTGQFNIFHVGAIVNFVFVVLAIVPLLRNPRPANWKLQHYHFIAWSYVGLIAAAVTEFIVRISHLATRDLAWAVTSVTAITVTAIGYVLIERYRPPSHPSPGDTIQRDGAPI